MPRFELYQSPEAPRRRKGAHAAAWAVLCIALQLAVLFWLWVEITS